MSPLRIMTERKVLLLEVIASGRLNVVVKRKDPVKAFGTVLRELREALNWTQEDLAGELDCDRAYVSQLERGVQNPSLLTMAKLAKILSVDITFAGQSLMH